MATWQDVKASRAYNTDYTNSTGRPIQVSVGITTTSQGSGILTVDGVAIYGSYATSAGGYCYVTAIVPSGSSYKATTNGAGGAIGDWKELR